MSETENNLEQRDNELNKQMAKHPAEESIKVLLKDANRRKRQFQLLTITVIITLLLVIGLAVVSYKLYKTSKLAQSTKAAVIASCETSNEGRRNNRALWDFAFSLSPSQPQTDEQKAQAEQFKDFVNKTFAERDCQAEINRQ